jgi:phosphoribosylformylglycinamidine (FGAM) synthase PurS component
MASVEQVLHQYGSDTVRKMRALAIAKIEGASGSNTKEKSRSIKHIVDKMLFNYRNIGT